jgi:hypothetical protein
MFCRSTASAMASASRKSFLFDFQSTTEEVSTRTCLHPDQAGLQGGGKYDELLLGELLPQQHLARCVQGYEVKGRFAEINANRTNLHIDDPP